VQRTARLCKKIPGEMDFDDMSDLLVAAVSNAAGIDFESD